MSNCLIKGNLYVVSIFDKSIIVACHCEHDKKCLRAIRATKRIKKYREKIPKYYSNVVNIGIIRTIRTIRKKEYKYLVKKYEKYKDIRKLLFSAQNIRMFIKFITKAYYIEYKRLEIIIFKYMKCQFLMYENLYILKNYVTCSRKLAYLYYVGYKYEKSYNICISMLNFIKKYQLPIYVTNCSSKFLIYNKLANIHAVYHKYYNLIKAKHYINLALKNMKDSNLLNDTKNSNLLNDTKKKIDNLISVHYDIDEKKESMYKTSKHIFKIKIVSLIDDIEYPILFNYHSSIF